jgi:GT2 family glycosyltransferase
VVEHAARNAGASRNFGAEHASAPLLIFLDDDIEAMPGLVQAHVRHRAPGQFLLGYSKPALGPRPSQWQMEARIWWEDRFRELARPGHRFTYRDFFSGNFSAEAGLFRRLGGFDATIASRLEDYELGLRLLRAGIRIGLTLEAVGLHHDGTDLAQWIRRIRDEGASDVRLATVHPYLRPRLFSDSEPWKRLERWLKALGFACGARGDRATMAVLAAARRLEELRLRKRRNQLVWAARVFNYWRGVSAVSGGRKSFDRWRAEVEADAPVPQDSPVYDIAAPPPIEDLQRILEDANKYGLRIVVDGVEAMLVPPDPTAEPLREEHVYRLIRDLTRHSFVPGVARQLVRRAGVTA